MPVKNDSKGPIGIPVDIDDPPSYIPLHPMEDSYQLVEELGNGSFGSVSLARARYDLINYTKKDMPKSLQTVQLQNTLMDCSRLLHDNYVNKSQGLVAIKTMITKLPTLHDYTRVREIKFILAIPANKHLIQIFEIFIDTKNFQLHIVMECMEQNLYQMMRHRKRRIFSLPSLKSILAQILAGIKHIHAQNFFHRDIKPENILVSPSTRYFNKEYMENGNYKDNYVVKLADFGLARHVNNKNPYTAYVSTRWYRSPEILLRSGFYSKPLDIWAFGCVAFEVAIFKPLFPGSNEMDQMWKILEVLGTPHSTEESGKTGYISHGGSWEVAKDLAHSLNLKFPYVEGASIDSILTSHQLVQLSDVIKSCLRWNPNERSTAINLCKMPFFLGTVVDDNTISTPEKSTTEQARMFAGIKLQGYQSSRQLLFKSSMLEDKDFIEIDENYDNNRDFEDVDSQKQLSLTQVLNQDIHAKRIEDDEADEDFEDFEDHDDILEAGTGSTLSISEDDDFDLSEEIEKNLAYCPLLNSDEDNAKAYELNKLVQLSNNIEDLDKEKTGHGSFTDFYGKLVMNDSAMKHNYTHKNNSLTDDNFTSGPPPPLDNSVYPVHRLLDNMSIDDSFNNSLNNPHRLSYAIPRSFIIPQIANQQDCTSLSDHTQQYGNLTF